MRTELEAHNLTEPPSKLRNSDSPKPAAALEDIERGVDQADGKSSIQSWNPPFSGDIDIRIAADGSWYHLGSEIRRERLVRLFSTILRREDDGAFYLVTPVEKFRITVDDAPFVAVGMAVSGKGRDQEICFNTNVEDTVTVNTSHPLRFETVGASGEIRPYVMVRDGLEALVSRAVFYDLVELGTTHEMSDGDWYGVWSCGAFCAMAPAAELDM